MKKILTRVATMLIYLVILLWLVNFKLLILFNFKYIVIVLLGSGILTLSSYKKGIEPEELIAAGKWNIQITGYLTTFVLQLTYVSTGYDSNSLLYEVVMNCRPLLYAAILYIIVNGLSEKQTVDEETEVDWKALGLTSREITIVERLLKDHSNKDIGEQLFISESTVKKHIYNIFKKLEITNREQLKHIKKRA